MSDYHINIFYSEEDGGYIADLPDLESCSAFGATPEEALESVLAILDAAKRSGKVDPNRVYVTGHSMGGFGTWTLGAHHAVQGPRAQILRERGGAWVSTVALLLHRSEANDLDVPRDPVLPPAGRGRILTDDPFVLERCVALNRPCNRCGGNKFCLPAYCR